MVDVSDIFYFFLLWEGEGGVRGARSAGGVRCFSENPRRGGVFQRGRGRGAGRVELGNFLGGGGGLIFFFWAETSTKINKGRTPAGACNNAPFSEGFLVGFSRLLSIRF